MANEEHLKILRQGVEAWNAWRGENAEEQPNFSKADLSKKELDGANFRTGDFSGATLRWASLHDADFYGANLERANLSEANLYGVDFTHANLCDATISGANLRETKLFDANVKNTDFSDAHFRHTILSASDLRNAKSLESIVHWSPSVLGVDVFRQSQGQLPAAFLKGCGLSDWEIEATKLHNPNLTQDERTNIWYEIERLHGEQPIQFNPLFISYSHSDAPFIDMLGQLLDERGIRFWLDDKDLKAGRLETQIDRAIRHNPTVLLVLSERSVESDWVEWEVATARKLEKELKRDVLCPVALDDKWKTCDWPGVLRRQIEDYHILDFSAWKDAGSFEGQFGKLLEGLKLFYRGEG